MVVENWRSNNSRNSSSNSTSSNNHWIHAKHSFRLNYWRKAPKAWNIHVYTQLANRLYSSLFIVFLFIHRDFWPNSYGFIVVCFLRLIRLWYILSYALSHSLRTIFRYIIWYISAVWMVCGLFLLLLLSSYTQRESGDFFYWQYFVLRSVLKHAWYQSVRTMLLSLSFLYRSLTLTSFYRQSEHGNHENQKPNFHHQKRSTT